MFSIDLKLDGMREIEAALNPQTHKKAMNRTLNDLGKKMQTATVKNVRSEYNVKSGEVKSHIKTRKSRYSKLKYSMEVSGKVLNLMNFSARQTRKGVTAKVKKAGGRKVVRGAFIGNKGRTVFKRVGKNRLPIKALKTLSVPQMFNEKRLKEAEELIQKDYFVMYDRNFSFYSRSRK